MTQNRNETERFGMTPGQIDAVFARSSAQAMADRNARQHAAEWPSVIERALAVLVGRSAKQDEALVALDARIAALEAATTTNSD